MFLCLSKDKPQDDSASEIMGTSISDMEDRLSRLVAKVLGCKNCSVELNPTTIAQQVEKAEVRFKTEGNYSL